MECYLCGAAMRFQNPRTDPEHGEALFGDSIEVRIRGKLTTVNICADCSVAPKDKCDWCGAVNDDLIGCGEERYCRQCVWEATHEDEPPGPDPDAGMGHCMAGQTP